MMIFHSFYRFWSIGLLWCCLVVWSQAQNDATQAYQNEPLVVHEGFDNTTWKKEAGDLRYTVKPSSSVVKPEVAANPTRNRALGTGDGIDGRTLSRLLLILLGLGVVVFVIYRLVGGNAVLSNRSIERRTPVRLEDIETNLQNADVESFLDKAIRQQEYRLAIRLYYLAIIKKLSQKGYIHWRKEKTNGQYLQELRQKKHPKTKDFREVTRVFERVWYSTMPFDGGQFQEVRLGFNELLKTLK